MPFFFALLVLLPLRWIVGRFDAHAPVVDVALQLVAALLFVRLGVYVFAADGRQVLDPRLGEPDHHRAWLVTISFELLGWFDRPSRRSTRST